MGVFWFLSSMLHVENSTSASNSAFDTWQLPSYIAKKNQSPYEYNSFMVNTPSEPSTPNATKPLSHYTSNFALSNSPKELPKQSNFYQQSAGYQQPVDVINRQPANSYPYQNNGSFDVNTPYGMPPVNYNTQSNFPIPNYPASNVQPTSPLPKSTNRVQDLLSKDNSLSKITKLAGKSNAIIPASPQPPREYKGKHTYCDITEFLNMPQIQAAKIIGVPTSTLSKRWKESAPTRKWPWRTVCKIDKEMVQILKDVQPGAQVPRESRDKLALLIRQRQEELRPIVIRI